ncbi:MAG: hypothetical protein ABW110_09725 [Steroidobacteraceae bacterium]
MQTRIRFATFVVAMTALASFQASAANSEAPLLTAQQKEVDRVAVSLRDEPAVKAARAAMVKRWQALKP